MDFEKDHWRTSKDMREVDGGGIPRVMGGPGLQ
jgi:hypothetical protein